MIELLVTLSILAVILMMAVPSFGPTLRSNRLFAVQSEVMSSLALARSEAAKRGVPVGVKAPGASVASGNEWGTGWSVWVDSNANGAIDAGEPVLRAHEPLVAGLTLSVPNNGVIEFDAHGFLLPAPSPARQLKACSSTSGAPGYQITVRPNGLADSASAACP
ncbi:GspH/FimT family pseudopilin [Ralstonia sp. 21MJYT02-11]|uniref:Type II secretion system protein H n=1 Tax=Ralstonia soli TaxID=2953896 RepID=A0ABT1AJW0_9RALS|nr:GspH/FimT family pseudopilin [Ralstonia soli]MCO5398442.1 GspH/FimT family pseudopilin [Ralstonia soli]